MLHTHHWWFSFLPPKRQLPVQAVHLVHVQGVWAGSAETSSEAATSTSGSAQSATSNLMGDCGCSLESPLPCRICRAQLAHPDPAGTRCTDGTRPPAQPPHLPLPFCCQNAATCDASFHPKHLLTSGEGGWHYVFLINVKHSANNINQERSLKLKLNLNRCLFKLFKWYSSDYKR